MVWYAENYEQSRQAEGNSGAIPFCVPTSACFFIGDSQMSPRKKRKDTRSWRRRPLYKWNCYNKLRYAVRVGKIEKPLLCENCNEEKRLEAHHSDYAKPLLVVWLCCKCHTGLHRKTMALSSDAHAKCASPSSLEATRMWSVASYI